VLRGVPELVRAGAADASALSPASRLGEAAPLFGSSE